MKDFLIVFKHEFSNFINNKAIRITTIIILLVAVAGIFWPNISGVFSNKADTQSNQTEQAASKNEKVILVNGSQDAFTYLEQAISSYKMSLDNSISENDAKAKVDNDSVFAVLFVDESMNYKMIVKDVSIFDSLNEDINSALTLKAKQNFMLSKGLDQKDIEAVDHIQVVGTTEVTGKNFMHTGIYAYILLFLIYMSVIAYGQTVSSSVVSEKSSRTMELLITSVKPTSLMFGKVMAAGAAGLLQMVLLIAVSMGLYQLNSSAWGNNELISSIFNIPAEILAFGIIFFIIGFFIYAFLYGAIGSLISRMEDINSAVMPVMFLLIISFFVAYSAIMVPDAGWVKVCSYIPIFTPLVMFVRECVSTVSPVESVIAIIISAAAAIAIGWMAAKIYRVGVLMYGKPPKVKEVWKAIKQK